MMSRLSGGGRLWLSSIVSTWEHLQRKLRNYIENGTLIDCDHKLWWSQRRPGWRGLMVLFEIQKIANLSAYFKCRYSRPVPFITPKNQLCYKTRRKHDKKCSTFLGIWFRPGHMSAWQSTMEIFMNENERLSLYWRRSAQMVAYMRVTIAWVTRKGNIGSMKTYLWPTFREYSNGKSSITQYDQEIPAPSFE